MSDITIFHNNRCSNSRGARAMTILKQEFNVDRLAIVGGGHIDGGFLDAGLIDEISLLVGAGVDGREGMPAVFDGRASDHDVVPLKLESVEAYGDDAVWLRYLVKH